MMIAPPLTGLVDDVKFDVRNTLVDHAERFRRGIGDVDNPATNIRTTIIDADRDRLARRDICHTQPRAEWQSAMRSGQFIRVKFFTARRLRVFRVEARYASGCRWRLASVLMARKGSVPCCSDTRPLIAMQRRVTASACAAGFAPSRRWSFEIPGRDGRLRACPEQGRPDHHNRKPNAGPDSPRRDFRNGKTSIARSKIDS